VKRGWWGSLGLGSGREGGLGGWQRRVCSRCKILCGGFASLPCGCSLQYGASFHAWMQVGVGRRCWQRGWFESECHTLQYHLLVKVWRAEGGLAETVGEGLQRLVLFLSDAEEREGCSLRWTVASEVSSEHVGEAVKAVNGVWR